MKKTQFLLPVAALLLLSGCAGFWETVNQDAPLMDGCFDCLLKPAPKKPKPITRTPCANRFYTGPAKETFAEQDPQTVYPNDECAIALQNQETREIAYCYGNSVTSAESCAQHYEEQGFTRLREIPYKTANYDFLHVDTYPTRRWRDAEITSRW